MYGRIPYLNNDWSSWAIHSFFLRRLLYYIAVWLGASPSVPLTKKANGNQLLSYQEQCHLWKGTTRYQQRTTGNSQSTRQIVTIPTRHGREIWSIGRLQKPKYFKELHKLNGWQARWYLKLQNHNFTLWHIPGKTNMKEDILSRREKVNTKEDNQDIQMLKEEL